MIKVIEKKECCGCAACEQKCPKKCITLHEDNEGFLFPQIDIKLCEDYLFNIPFSTLILNNCY